MKLIFKLLHPVGMQYLSGIAKVRRESDIWDIMKGRFINLPWLTAFFLKKKICLKKLYLQIGIENPENALRHSKINRNVHLWQH